MNEYANAMVPTGPNPDFKEVPAERRGKKDADRKDGEGTHPQS